MIGNILSNSLLMFSGSKISAQRKRLAPSYYTCVGGLIVATTEFLQKDCVHSSAQLSVHSFWRFTTNVLVRKNPNNLTSMLCTFF
mmetsp:Transcript_22258/g.34388  ORF Transcript_22258/g.34388 Transcript_22258/m.34388 type:complete len:85 (+) Transcript_22258:1875-2129(+)